MTSRSTLHFDRALLPGGWASDVRVTVADGRIDAIEAGAPVDAAGERHALGLPGLGNGHSHAFQRAMAGLTEWKDAAAASFWNWRDTMYRFLDRLGPDELEAIAAQAYVEMLEAGFTRVGEFHYLHHDPQGHEYADPGEMAARVMAAAADTGIALTLLPVFYAHAGFGGAPPDGGATPVHLQPRPVPAASCIVRARYGNASRRGARRRAAQPARGGRDGAARAYAAAAARPISSAHRRAEAGSG